MIKNVYWPLCKYLFLLDFNNFGFLDMFAKDTQVSNFIKNLANGNQVVPCGWMDRHDEADSRFSQFCERA
jgi:hypothetical protein